MDTSQDIKPESFEIDTDRSQNRPLSSQRGYTNPMPGLTRGMKPSTLKKYSYRILFIIPVIFYVMVSALTWYQISLTGGAMMSEFEGIKGVLDDTFLTACSIDPINKITVVNKGESCPEGMERANIGQWPGTHAGCYNRMEGKVRKGECNHARDEKHVDIRETKASNYTVWKDRGFCISRISNYVRKDSDVCETHQRLCWANPGYYCIPKSQACPISSIEKINGGPPEEKDRNKNDTYIQVGQTLFYKYQNIPETSGSLADLTTSITSTPCLDPAVSPKRVSGNGYEFTNKPTTGCGRYGFDADSRMIDDFDEKTFYEQNGIMTNEIFNDKALPIAGDKMVLIAKFEKIEVRHLGCNMCSKDFGWRLQTGDDELHTLNRYYKRYSKIGAVLITAMLLVLAYNLTMFWKHKDNLEVMNSKTWTVNLVMLGFLLGHYITAGAFAALSYYELSRAAYATDILVEWRCFQNDGINRAMRDFHNDYIKTNLKITVDGIAVIAVSVIAVVLFMIADYMLHDIKTKENLKEIREEAEHRVPIDTRN